MCGKSKVKLKDNEIKIFLGFNWSYIRINGKRYSPDEELDGKNKITREELINELGAFSAEELAELIAQLVDNGDEG